MQIAKPLSVRSFGRRLSAAWDARTVRPRAEGAV